MTSNENNNNNFHNHNKLVMTKLEEEETWDNYKVFNETSTKKMKKKAKDNTSNIKPLNKEKIKMSPGLQENSQHIHLDQTDNAQIQPNKNQNDFTLSTDANQKRAIINNENTPDNNSINKKDYHLNDYKNNSHQPNHNWHKFNHCFTALTKKIINISMLLLSVVLTMISGVEMILGSDYCVNSIWYFILEIVDVISILFFSFVIIICTREYKEYTIWLVFNIVVIGFAVYQSYAFVKLFKGTTRDIINCVWCFWMCFSNIMALRTLNKSIIANNKVRQNIEEIINFTEIVENKNENGDVSMLNDGKGTHEWRWNEEGKINEINRNNITNKRENNDMSNWNNWNDKQN